jgi:hypothetical protein
MKKITLGLLVLCLALPVFAGDADAASVELNGSATTTFGVDLESGATGFQNSITAEIQFHFNIPTTATKSGMDMGTIYGEILLDEILVDSVQSADSSTVYWDVDIAVDYAKIYGPNWWLSVLGPDNTVDYENALQNGIIGIAAAWDGQMDSVNNTVTSSGGFEAGFSVPDVAGVEVSLFSMTDWTATSDENAYGFKASVAVTAVENLTLGAAVNMGFGTEAGSTLNDAVGIGGQVAYSISAGDITIKPDIAADVVLVDDGANIAIGNGVTIGLPGSEITAAEDGVKDDAGNSLAWDDGVNSGLTLGYSYYMPAVGDPALGLQAHFGLSSIENFQLAVGYEVDDILADTNTMGIAAYTQYTMGDIKPWAGMYMEFDGRLFANAGLTWTNIVPLTTFTLDWRSGDLSLADPDLGIFKAAVKVAY